MNTVTSAEANQKFTKMTSQVDSEGCVAITKNGKEVYIMMTVNEFAKLKEAQLISDLRIGLWLMEGRSLSHIKVSEEKAVIRTLTFADESLKEISAYTFAEIPESDIKINISANETNLEYSWRRGTLKGGTTEFLLKDPDKEADKTIEIINEMYEKVQTLDRQTIIKGRIIQMD